MKAEPSLPNQLLMIPPLKIITMSFKFQHKFWRGHSNDSSQYMKINCIFIYIYEINIEKLKVLEVLDSSIKL